MEQKAFYKAYLIMVSAALMVAAYPLLHQQMPLLDHNLRSYGVFPHFLLPIPADSLSMRSPVVASVPDSISSSEVEATAQVATEPEMPVIDDYQGIAHLAPFFKKLHQRKSQLRIAYYGDSSIEGDLICMTFRDSLQRKFGGRGVGFVPLMSQHAGFRRSVYQSASDNWHRYVVGSNSDSQFPGGISGEYFTARDTQQDIDTSQLDSLAPTTPHLWATFKGSRRLSRTGYFESARLFYGQPPVDSNRQLIASLSVQTEQQRRTYTLQPQAPINSLTILDSTARQIRLEFSLSDELPLYGVSLESKKGVIVDNFPLRGNDGSALRSIPTDVLQAFQQALNYDLIVFHFGLNVLNAQSKDYSWYQRKIERLIDHYQQAMPGVPILVLGITDKGTRVDGSMQSDPGILYVTAAQSAAAQKKGVAFFSLYEAMGGAGTMVRWVEDEQPRLANTDYTHFTFKGAQRIGDYLLTFLNEHYMNYVVQQSEVL